MANNENWTVFHNVFQPITGLDRPNEMWPERVALAVLVFPDMRSGEDWLAEVSERGDKWYSCCDAVIIPANWSVPQSEWTSST